MWAFVYSLARVLMPLLFVFEGIAKFTNIGTLVERLQAANLPIPAELDSIGVSRFVLIAYGAAVIEIVCGVMVIVGYRTRTAALILALYTAGTIVIGHPFWAMEGQIRAVNLTSALKNLSIIAGLLIIAALGPGRYSLDGRRRGG